MPLDSPTSPASMAPSSSSRTNSGLPRLSSHSWRALEPTSGPPRIDAAMADVVGSSSGSTSRRSRSPSFHRAVTAGRGSGVVRAVATITGSPNVARWWTRAREVSSSRWMSSTTRTPRRPRVSTTAVAADRRRSSSDTVCSSREATREAKAPRRSVAAASVALTVAVPCPARPCGGPLPWPGGSCPCRPSRRAGRPGRPERHRGQRSSSAIRPMSGRSSTCGGTVPSLPGAQPLEMRCGAAPEGRPAHA